MFDSLHRLNRNVAVGVILGLFLVASVAEVKAETAHSAPVGFVRFEVPTGSDRVTSIPLERPPEAVERTLAATVDSVIAGASGFRVDLRDVTAAGPGDVRVPRRVRLYGEPTPEVPSAIERRLPGERIWLAEGYATAATVHEITDDCVVCAFDAHNLIKVAAHFRSRFIDHEIWVAADNDDAGIKAATDAMKQHNLEGWVAPDDWKTDRNDHSSVYGAEQTLKKLNSVEGHQ